MQNFLVSLCHHVLPNPYSVPLATEYARAVNCHPLFPPHIHLGGLSAAREAFLPRLESIFTTVCCIRP